jgi:hypothetical protein
MSATGPKAVIDHKELVAMKRRLAKPWYRGTYERRVVCDIGRPFNIVLDSPNRPGNCPAGDIEISGR